MRPRTGRKRQLPGNRVAGAFELCRARVKREQWNAVFPSDGENPLDLKGSIKGSIPTERKTLSKLL
jgi:hypothetical protein